VALNFVTGQKVFGVAGLSGSVTVSATLNGCTSGNDLLIAVVSESQGVSSVTSPGLTLVHLGTQYQPLSTGAIDFYTVHLASGGNITVTANTSVGTNSLTVGIFEISGATSLVLDSRGDNQTISGAIAATTTAAAGSLCLFVSYFYPGQFSGDSGWTYTGSVATSGAAYVQTELKVSTGGSETGSFNGATSGNGQSYSSLIAVKDSGAGGGGSTYNDVIPAAGTPNDLKVTLGMSLANVATFPRSISYGVTLGFSQSVSNVIPQSPSYGVVLGFSLTNTKISNPSLTMGVTLGMSLANTAVFVNSMTQQVVLGFTSTIGFADNLAFNVNLAMLLGVSKITSPTLTMGVTLGMTLVPNVVASHALAMGVTLAMSLATTAIFPRSLSFPVALGFTVIGTGTDPGRLFGSGPNGSPVMSGTLSVTKSSGTLSSSSTVKGGFSKL
jgi:hypothetical protein